MKEIHEYEKDISSIRTMMERSVKFLSLSGLSGVLAGIYAIAGAAVAYFLLSDERFQILPDYSSDQPRVLFELLMVASIVLIASILTALWLSQRKAKRYNITLWNSASKRLMINLAIPLVTGGLFILIMLYMGEYGVAAPASLIFYGLALIQASQHTFDEVRYLGFLEIALGLVSLLFPGFGLIFWTIGFGILHIIYGSIMYFRHDQ